MDKSNIGHNNPPDPIELVTQEFDGTISEAQNWADGEPVTNEAGMKAVDAVLKEFKRYKTALTKAGKERTDPLHKAWKGEVAAVKIYTDDAEMLQKALVACVAPFKQKLADEKAKAEREAWEAADKARLEAEAIAAKSNAADIDDAREVQAARQAVIDAEKAAKKQGQNSVKGMRTVHHHEVNNFRALVNWIAQNDREAMTAFAKSYAERHFKTTAMDGVKAWTTKEAF